MLVIKNVTNLLLQTLTEPFELFLLLIPNTLPLHLQLLLLLLHQRDMSWLTLSQLTPESRHQYMFTASITAIIYHFTSSSTLLLGKMVHGPV